MKTAAAASGAPILRAGLVAVAGLAIAIPALVVSNPPTIRVPARVALPRARVVPKAEIPPVEPVQFVDLAPEDARAFNAHVPFSTAPNPAARPFRFGGGASDLARATDCMAAGVLYEAGDDTEGERAVAQVVLNRLRHPAFPKSVCGVVFEGQERTTGCQFSFSCDGAVRRWQPSDMAWRRAREVASAALAGSVYRPVGYATHYHTDSVVPYWQSSLDKITAVKTHLFFRWSGWWGTPPAFNRQPERIEPVIAQLATFSDAHRTGAALEEAGTAMQEANAAMGFAATVEEGTPAPVLPGDENSFLVTLPRGNTPDQFATLANETCGDRPFCRYLAWSDRTKAATTLPLAPAQRASLTFSYLRDRSSGYERTLWNCEQVKRTDPTQCMPQQAALGAMPVAATPVNVPTSAPARTLPAELDGVRRQAVPPPAPGPTPAGR